MDVEGGIGRAYASRIVSDVTNDGHGKRWTTAIEYMHFLGTYWL
jgi:hypothetical protein